MVCAAGLHCQSFFLRNALVLAQAAAAGDRYAPRRKRTGAPGGSYGRTPQGARFRAETRWARRWDTGLALVGQSVFGRQPTTGESRAVGLTASMDASPRAVSPLEAVRLRFQEQSRWSRDRQATGGLAGHARSRWRLVSGRRATVS
jgi:hypothetical protein